MNRRDSRHGFETRFCLSARSVAAATLTFYVADPLQSGKGYQTVQFYQLDGNTWRKLDSLESHAATTGPLDRSMANQKTG